MRKQFYIPFYKSTYTLIFNCEGYDIYLGGRHYDFTVSAKLESLNWEELIYKRADHREILALTPSNIELTGHYLQRIKDHEGRTIWETTRPEKKPVNKVIQKLKGLVSVSSSPFLSLALAIAYLWKRISKR